MNYAEVSYHYYKVPIKMINVGYKKLKKRREGNRFGQILMKNE